MIYTDPNGNKVMSPLMNSQDQFNKINYLYYYLKIIIMDYKLELNLILFWIKYDFII